MRKCQRTSLESHGPISRGVIAGSLPAISFLLIPVSELLATTQALSWTPGEKALNPRSLTALAIWAPTVAWAFWMLGSRGPVAASHSCLPYLLCTGRYHSLYQQRPTHTFLQLQTLPRFLLILKLNCKLGLRNWALHGPAPTILCLHHAFHQNGLEVGSGQKVKLQSYLWFPSTSSSSHSFTPTSHHIFMPVNEI